MNKTELKLCYDVQTEDIKGLPVIVVAAGSSTRMKGVNKQFAEIYGIPVIARTLMAFQNSKYIKNIILVVRTEDVFVMQSICEKYMISKLSDIVCGGETRQESVIKGISRLSKEDKSVLIHDGARPLVTEKIISDVVSALETHDAVICGVKLKDTIKEIDESGRVINTPKRSKLISVQTPQGVNIEKYKNALESVEDKRHFTDDASIMEYSGYQVYSVEGDYRNIKVTTPEDIAVAESFLKEAEECE